MKERPIIFSAESARAILQGRKTQTRRVMKPQPVIRKGFVYDFPVACGEAFFRKASDAITRYCRYGRPGDKDWRTGRPPEDGWYYVKDFAESQPVYLRIVNSQHDPHDYTIVWGWDEHDDPEALETEGVDSKTIKWKRAGDRLWVRETFSYREYAFNRIERLQNFHYWADGEVKFGNWSRPVSPIFMPRWASRITLDITSVRVERVQEISEEDARAEGVEPDKETGSYKDSFMVLWDRLNARRGFGWDKNPWVWVIEFRVIENPEGGE